MVTYSMRYRGRIGTVAPSKTTIQNAPKRTYKINAKTQLGKILASISGETWTGLRDAINKTIDEVIAGLPVAYLLLQPFKLFYGFLHDIFKQPILDNAGDLGDKIENQIFGIVNQAKTQLTQLINDIESRIAYIRNTIEALEQKAKQLNKLTSLHNEKIQELDSRLRKIESMFNIEDKLVKLLKGG